MNQINITTDSKLVKLFSWSVHELLLCILCGLLVWFAQYHWHRRRIYRIAKQVPGPQTWPIIGNGIKFLGNSTDIFNNIMDMFNDYPNLVAVWLVNKLLYGVTKPEYIEIILNSPKTYGKSELYNFLTPAVGDGLLTAPVDKWKKHRKLINPTFNQRILNEFVEVFAEQSEDLTRRLSLFAGKGRFDVFTSVAETTINTVCETTMGIQIDSEKDGSDFGKWVDRGMEIVFLRIGNLWYHFDAIFRLTSHHRELQKLIGNVNGFVKKIVVEKRRIYETKLEKGDATDKNQRKALLDLLIELSSEGIYFTDQEIMDQVTTFTIGGTDTNATSISFILIMLGMHQDVQKKVYDEIVNVIGLDRRIHHSDLSQLKYLERVIKEGLRLFPAGPCIVRSINEDLALGDYTLSAGGDAALGILVVHRSAQYWPEPLRFDPDRFLPEECAKRHPYAYLPFSAGVRNCIGARYAMMVMKTMVAAVVRRYRVNTPYKTVEDVKLKIHLILRPQNGFIINLENRS